MSTNPWMNISLSDYENHMSLEEIKQLQKLNHIMKEQFEVFPVYDVMILGVAGGNGLEHIDVEKYHHIYGVDINEQYLLEVKNRYKDLGDALEMLCVDLSKDVHMLPKTELLIANLLIEYIGYDSFLNVVKHTCPGVVSCVIQINESDEFVSDSPYLHVFDRLEEIHQQMESDKLSDTMKSIGYEKIGEKEYALPNGKKFVRLDYNSAI